jgi:serine/threonine protein kinase
MCIVFISYLDPTDHANGMIDVKLGDFGCAKQLDDETSMSDTGTIRYRAPVSLGHC